MKRLLTHSVLHLMGFDHVKGGRQARLMKEKEEAVLKALSSLARAAIKPEAIFFTIIEPLWRD